MRAREQLSILTEIACHILDLFAPIAETALSIIISFGHVNLLNERLFARGGGGAPGLFRDIYIYIIEAARSAQVIIYPLARPRNCAESRKGGSRLVGANIFL